MIIQQIEIYKSPVKLRKPFVISLGLLAYAENIFVAIRTEKGITGFGECSPFKTINGESMDTGFIVGQYLAKGLLGKNPLDIEECSHVMDKIIYGNSSIKSAFNIALFDIASQDAGLPLFQFLGGKKGKELITDYTVSLGDPKIMADDAQIIKDRGFQFIKVKLGAGGKKDVERINEIRNRIGYDLSLRIDANQGWTPGEAIETLSALAPFNIQFCEEPVPRWNYMELSRINAQSPIPVMADESCCDSHDAKRLIDLEACGHFNVKLGKSSGISEALKIVSLAEKAGIIIQVGGFLESRLGFTASAHLAMISDNIQYCDFDSPLMFTEDPVDGGITYSPAGVVSLPDKPGLGASVRKDFLAALEHIVLKH